MSVEKLPWESLEGPIYYAREMKGTNWRLVFIGRSDYRWNYDTLPCIDFVWNLVCIDIGDEKRYGYYRAGT